MLCVSVPQKPRTPGKVSRNEIASRKLRAFTDPFVVALAQVDQLQIVTDEKLTGNLQRPNIRDIVFPLGMKPCIGLLELIRAEKWIVG